MDLVQSLVFGVVEPPHHDFELYDASGKKRVPYCFRPKNHNPKTKNPISSDVIISRTPRVRYGDATIRRFSCIEAARIPPKRDLHKPLASGEDPPHGFLKARSGRQ